MRFEALLGRTVRGFWASTYSFDLKLFDQYVLRRLAPSPLNAVVLADRDKLATVWEGLHEGQEYLARQVGRRYLLRGVAPPGGGAFHPKTYLFARADHATLIIGSGNLTRPGIDGGREVFTPLTTQRSEDLPTMRAWAQWMGRLVHRQVDPLLLERWTALREASPWITGDSDGSRFLSNDDESLLDQLARRLPGNIDRPSRDGTVLRPQRRRAAPAHQRLLRQTPDPLRRRRSQGARSSARRRPRRSPDCPRCGASSRRPSSTPSSSASPSAARACCSAARRTSHTPR